MHSWNHIEKWPQMITISYHVAIYSLEYIIIITIEIRSKNGPKWYIYHIKWQHTSPDYIMVITAEIRSKTIPDDTHIILCGNTLSGLHNHHHGWNQIKKWCKKHIHTCIFDKLPNMVSLIMKWTLPLDLYWKMGPGHITWPILKKSKHISQLGHWWHI